MALTCRPDLQAAALFNKAGSDSLISQINSTILGGISWSRHTMSFSHPAKDIRVSLRIVVLTFPQNDTRCRVQSQGSVVI
jgi:hypothetical protein